MRCTGRARRANRHRSRRNQSDRTRRVRESGALCGRRLSRAMESERSRPTASRSLTRTISGTLVVIEPHWKPSNPRIPALVVLGRWRPLADFLRTFADRRRSTLLMARSSRRPFGPGRDHSNGTRPVWSWVGRLQGAERSCECASPSKMPPAAVTSASVGPVATASEVDGRVADGAAAPARAR